MANTQALLYNKPGSTMVFLVADCEATPDSPVAEIDSFFGANVWSFRVHSSHVTDGAGSLGGNHHFGGHWEKAAWFYPNPNHTDGSHCDTLMQIHYGDVHVAKGNNVDGYVDSSASSTTDSTNHPIPTRGTSCVLIGAATPIPTNLYLADNDLGGGQLAVNIANYSFPSLGQVLRNLVHISDSEKCQYVQGIEAPPSASGLTLHVNIPNSGSDANLNESGAVLVPYSAPGSSITWP